MHRERGGLKLKRTCTVTVWQPGIFSSRRSDDRNQTHHLHTPKPRYSPGPIYCLFSVMRGGLQQGRDQGCVGFKLTQRMKIKYRCRRKWQQLWERPVESIKSLSRPKWCGPLSLIPVITERSQSQRKSRAWSWKKQQNAEEKHQKSIKSSFSFFFFLFFYNISIQILNPGRGSSLWLQS